MALKEFCFLKVAHGIGVAPKPTKNIGFDMIFYSNCVEFTMEKCSTLDESLSKVKAEDIEALKGKLWLMHYFKIAHMDIKPDNIVFSSIL